jgi:hypothetical protein
MMKMEVVWVILCDLVSQKIVRIIFFSRFLELQLVFGVSRGAVGGLAETQSKIRK